MCFSSTIARVRQLAHDCAVQAQNTLEFVKQDLNEFGEVMGEATTGLATAIQVRSWPSGAAASSFV